MSLDIAWEPLAIVGAIAAVSVSIVAIVAAVADPPPGSSEKTVEMIEAAVPEEKEAIEDYTILENSLRSEGLLEDADIVHEIKNDEVDHKAKFEAMLEKRGKPISCV